MRGYGGRHPLGTSDEPLPPSRSMARRPMPWPLAVVLAALVAGCGGGGGDDGDDGSAPSTDGPGEATSTVEEGEVVPADLVVLTEGADSHPEGDGPGLVVDGVDVRAFAGRFLVAGSEGVDVLDELADDLDDGPGERVYVGGVVSEACAGPDDVEVRRVGSDVRLVPVGPDDDPEEVCDRAISTVALAAVDRDDLPEDMTIDGEEPSAPVGPGEVVVFASVEGRPRAVAEELRTADDTAGFLDDVGALGAGRAGEVGADVRRFGFVISGCRAVTAELVVADGEIAAAARAEGHEDGREVDCDAEERYVVVADVPVSASGGLEPAV